MRSAWGIYYQQMRRNFARVPEVSRGEAGYVRLIIESELLRVEVQITLQRDGQRKLGRQVRQERRGMETFCLPSFFWGP